jgi:leucyl-tRNA synthetase
MSKFDHKAIEMKWTQFWSEKNLNKALEIPRKGQKKYILDMWPYPSGLGLHVGHVEGYTGTDIVARYNRMKGFDVLHPIGWDAFGLPAENYAIKTGVAPQELTHKSIATFKKQIDEAGLSYDWSRELNSSDPDYYKWTQWLFILLYKRGLAYKKKAPANWCPSCETVLANEQVVNGHCERCDTQVERKDLDQWFFKITEYADRLIEGLDRIDWPASTKAIQRNWIGKSEGHKISFGDIEVFTTRIDTLHGATFLALAPDHLQFQIRSA